VIDRRSILLLRVVLPLAAAAVLAQICYPLVRGTARDALTVVAVLLFAAASLAHSAVTRGARTAVTVLALLGAGGLLVEAVGTASGVPFGRYAYTGSLGPALLGVPLVVPLAWVMMGWPAYLVGARLGTGTMPRLAIAAWALASWDLFLDPQMVANGQWRWSDPSPTLPGVPGVPVTNYAGWLVVAAVLMVGLRTAAGPAAETVSTRDGVPYALYLWTYLSSVLAHAVFFGVPAAALYGGVGMGAVAVPLAVTLSRRAPAPPPAALPTGAP
jgi:uncharacterized membrane protein